VIDAVEILGRGPILRELVTFRIEKRTYLEYVFNIVGHTSWNDPNLRDKYSGLLAFGYGQHSLSGSL
jgi:hypothetical protein